MSAVRAPQVAQAPAFDDDVTLLRKTYVEIDAVVADLVAFLGLAWNPPHVLVDVETHPGIYVTQLDYPPLGSEGLSKFIVTYHARPGANPMQDPLCSYTLLSLVEQ